MSANSPKQYIIRIINSLKVYVPIMKKIALISAVLLIISGLGYVGYLTLGKNNYNGGEYSNISGDTSNERDVVVNKDELKCKDCNLVIISLTNTRKDHIGPYGYKRNTTPNIDKFFENSLVFDNAFAPASWTLPVAASLYTSLFPYSHKVMDRTGESKLPDEILTFAEILKSVGYKTAAFTGGGDYSARFNLGQGFDTYVEEGNYDNYRIPAKKGVLSYLNIEPLLPPVMDWLEENKDEKFFLLLQGYDTHCPFTPKPPFDKGFDPGYSSQIDFSNCLWTFERTEPVDKEGEKKWPVKTWIIDGKISEVMLSEKDIAQMVSLYDGEIAQVDDTLSKLFEFMKKNDLEKDTIFIFMAEHGDLFGEHGRFMRGGPLRGTFYDPVLNFPLLIKHPSINIKQRIDALIQTVDLMPSLLEILGINDAQKDVRQGKSIIPAIISGKEVNDYVYAGAQYQAKNSMFFKGSSKVEMIRSKEWKLIREEIGDDGDDATRTISYEFFNVAKDAKEEADLYGSDSDIVASLSKKLDQWIKMVK